MFVSTKKKDEHLKFWKLKWVEYQILMCLFREMNGICCWKDFLFIWIHWAFFLTDLKRWAFVLWKLKHVLMCLEIEIDICCCQKRFFNSFESIEFFFQIFGNEKKLKDNEKKEINGFYLNKIWKKTQNKLFVPTKKRWAFKIFWNWNEFDTKFWLQMKLSTSCCCWKAFVFIWVYWVFSKMSI